MVVGHPAAAKLDPGILPLAQQFRLEAKLEISILRSSAEEFIPGNPLLEGARNDFSLLDAEDLAIPLPTLEGLSIEQEGKARFRLEFLGVTGGDRQPAQTDHQHNRPVRKLPHG